MSQNKTVLFAMGLAAFLVLGFQNCSRVTATSTMAAPSDKVASTVDVDAPQLPVEGPVAQPMPTPPPASEAPLDPREIRCRGMSSSTRTVIAYDGKALTGAAPVSLGALSLFGRREVNAESVLSISNFAGQIKVTAAEIGSITNFASSFAEFNALSIDYVGSFASTHVQVVTHELGEASNFAGDFCASAQKIDSISNLASRLSLFGRSEGGKKAVLGHLGNVAGFVSIYDFEIGSLSNAAMAAKLVNSHLPKLENAAVDLILVDSVIDEVAHVVGTIRLRGSSKVLKHDSSARLIIE